MIHRIPRYYAPCDKGFHANYVLTESSSHSPALPCFSIKSKFDNSHKAISEWLICTAAKKLEKGASICCLSENYC